MQAWTLAGIRVDIELAVALEVGTLSLSRADSPAARDRAVAFNRDLWTLVMDLAATAPEAEDRAGLTAAANQLRRGQFADFAETNRLYAGRLAGRAATTGSLRQLLSDWRTHASAAPLAEFGAWLVSRLSRLAQTTQLPLAA